MANKRDGPEEQVTQSSGQYSLSCTVFSTHTKVCSRTERRDHETQEGGLRYNGVKQNVKDVVVVKCRY